MRKGDRQLGLGFINEPARNVPLVEDVDVCVLGGSCTGVFAAVRAARLGAKVAIVEKTNAFGGVRVMIQNSPP